MRTRPANGLPEVPGRSRKASEGGGGGVFEGFSLFILKNRRRVPNASDAAARAALYFGRFRPHLLTPRRWERRKKQPTLAPSLSEGPPGVNTQGQSLVAGLVITFCRLRCPCVPSPAGASVFHATPPAHQRRSLLLLLPPPPPPPLRCVDGNSSPSAHRRVRYSFRHWISPNVLRRNRSRWLKILTYTDNRQKTLQWNAIERSVFR